jgi:hypothetical protein
MPSVEPTTLNESMPAATSSSQVEQFATQLPRTKIIDNVLPFSPGEVVRTPVHQDFSAASAPLSPPAMETVPASAASSFEQRSDPASNRASGTPRTEAVSIAPDMQHAQSEAAAYDQYIAPPKGTRWGLVAAGLLLTAGAAYFIFNSVVKGRDRNSVRKDILTELSDAKELYASNKVSDAWMKAQSAQNRLNSDKGELLEPDFKKDSLDQVKFYATRGAEVNELDAKFKTGVENPEKMRAYLNEKKSLWEQEKGYDTKPMLSLLNAKFAELDNQEAKLKLTHLGELLADAEKLYVQQDVEGAGKVAQQIISEMPLKPAVQDLKLQKRAEILVGRAKTLAEATATRKKARDEQILPAKKAIQFEFDRLDPAVDDLKPLAARLDVLRTELVRMEQEYQEKVKQIEVAAKNKELEEKNRKAREPHALKNGDEDSLLKIMTQFERYDKRVEVGDLDVDGYKFKFDGRDYRMDLHRTGLGTPQLILETPENKILIDARHFVDTDKEFRQRWHRALYHAINLADAMKKAGVKSDELWDTREEAPFVSGRRVDKQGNEFIFLGDRLYVGKAQEKTGEQKAVDVAFREKAEALAKAVENDAAATSEDVRATIAFAVRSSGQKADWNDHQEGEFVRKVIDEGYIEQNMPGADERLKKELAEYRAAYKTIADPFLNFSGVCAEGEAAEFRTFEDRAVWRLYDKASDTTTFAITNPDDEKDCLFILDEYLGKLTDMPVDTPPAKVRMTHQAVGAMAVYDTATNKMEYDKAKWNFASTLELPPYNDDFRIANGYGTAPWALPPHVLLIDKSGRTKGIVTPYGRVDVQDFKKITDKAERKVAMDKFMDQLITALPDKPEGIYQHLYFRYFFQYILDSPVTDHPDLLGSRAHTGDIHQTTYQSLERLMGGRYVGDCDDIAELYMTLTRKMGKLSYVMALPSHAACGWVEKMPNSSDFVFQILQTGPPRRFVESSLDKVVERAYRAFDPEGTAHFDIKSLPFNFRFNDEPTRTTYWLSSRMYVDPAYGEAMERVQSYWHFHFYALGIETMLSMIEKDKDGCPENCNEVAGLYGQVREVENSIRWSNESIKGMDPSQKLSRMSERYRIATMWRSEHDNDKAWDEIKSTVSELKAIQKNRAESFDFLGMRLQVAGLLLILDRPWECWDLIRSDIAALGQPGNYYLKLEHMGTPTQAYLKMKDLTAGDSRNRKVLTKEENKRMEELGKVLDDFYSRGKSLFEDSDGFDDYMRKYAFVGMYYAGKYGRKKHLEEIMKDGPYPDPNQKRNHQKRKDVPNLVEEDWKWIRLSLSSYGLGIGDAIDLDDPPEKWRKDEAIALCDQMQKVAKVTPQFGSLGTYEFMLLSNRVLRDFLVKDWADLETVVKETARRDWAKLTTDVCETFGRGARFVTPEEFATQYRMLTKYIKSKPSYFTVVYEAYRADAFQHAIMASKIALECNPGNKDMEREAAYLEKLAEQRIKRMAEKEKEKAAKEKAEKEKAEKEKSDKAKDPEGTGGVKEGQKILEEKNATPK